MNRFKRIVIFTVLIIISAGALFAIRNVERKMDNLVDQERLRFSGDVRNALRWWHSPRLRWAVSAV